MIYIICKSVTVIHGRRHSSVMVLELVTIDCISLHSKKCYSFLANSFHHTHTYIVIHTTELHFVLNLCCCRCCSIDRRRLVTVNCVQIVLLDWLMVIVATLAKFKVDAQRLLSDCPFCRWLERQMNAPMNDTFYLLVAIFCNIVPNHISLFILF